MICLEKTRGFFFGQDFQTRHASSSFSTQAQVSTSLGDVAAIICRHDDFPRPRRPQVAKGVVGHPTEAKGRYMDMDDSQ